ncbi:hypothetical protein GCM10009765_48090 [Fodinicola feengrottensis]|uniref:Uncharacterized protein n=1 Tax=Fodinicola feengrottensis TaxID=435914 RepID=A0ABN2HT42_9ACTN
MSGDLFSVYDMRFYLSEDRSVREIDVRLLERECDALAVEGVLTLVGNGTYLVPPVG